MKFLVDICKYSAVALSLWLLVGASSAVRDATGLDSSTMANVASISNLLEFIEDTCESTDPERRVGLCLGHAGGLDNDDGNTPVAGTPTPPVSTPGSGSSDDEYLYHVIVQSLERQSHVDQFRTGGRICVQDANGNINYNGYSLTDPDQRDAFVYSVILNDGLGHQLCQVYDDSRDIGLVQLSVAPLRENGNFQKNLSERDFLESYGSEFTLADCQANVFVNDILERVQAVDRVLDAGEDEVSIRFCGVTEI